MKLSARARSCSHTCYRVHFLPCHPPNPTPPACCSQTLLLFTPPFAQAGPPWVELCILALKIDSGNHWCTKLPALWKADCCVKKQAAVLKRGCCVKKEAAVLKNKLNAARGASLCLKRSWLGIIPVIPMSSPLFISATQPRHICPGQELDILLIQ